MTVSTTTSRIGYNGNGVTTIFAVPFRFLKNTDLIVTLVDASLNQYVKVLNTDYTVTGAGDDAGGSITMVVAPATGQQLIIVREVPLTQETDYITGDPFPAETHERALDKLTMITQRLDTLIDRSIKISDADLAVTNTVLPAPSPGSSLIWNPTGTALVNGVPVEGTLAISPYMEVVLGSADAAEARTNLQVAAEVDTVLMTGNQTIAGIKTFSSSPVVPTATTSGQAANKGQMDTAVAASVVPATLAPTLFVETTPKPLNTLAAVEWAGIPSWVRRITIAVSGQSGSSTGVAAVRIGTGGAAETTGYDGAASFCGTATAIGTNTTFWRLTDTAVASSSHNHVIIISKVTGNTWVYSSVGSVAAAGTVQAGGSKTLAGALDMVQLIMTSGTFDGGTATLYYE